MKKDCKASRVALKCEAEHQLSSLQFRLEASLNMMPEVLIHRPADHYRDPHLLKARRELASTLNLFTMCTDFDSGLDQGSDAGISDASGAHGELTTMAKVTISKEGRRKIDRHLKKIRMIGRHTVVKIATKGNETVIETKRGVIKIKDKF